MVPDRLSYSEMSTPEFKYPGVWTESMESYNAHKDMVVAKVIDYMENYNSYKIPMNTQLYNLKRSFFSGEALYKEVSNG